MRSRALTGAIAAMALSLSAALFAQARPTPSAAASPSVGSGAHADYALSPEKRAAALAMRLQNARNGLRQPLQVMDGNYERMDGTCPWWDSTFGRSGSK